MDLQKLFEQRLQKIDFLKDFIVLYGKKRESIPELILLSNEVLEVKELLQTCAQIVEKFQTQNRSRTENLIEKFKIQQTLMLKVMEQLDELESPAPPPQEANTQPNYQTFASPARLKPTTNKTNEQLTMFKEISNTNTPCKNFQFKPGSTPIMTLSDYVKSPFTSKRMKPISLQFSDFDRIISAEEFSKIPSYMRGRETLDDLQCFLDNVIIRSFTLKYALLPKRREAVSPAELDLWNLYKAQEEYFKGLKFITQGDICRLIDKQIDKKTSSRITVMRHIKIIREERKNSAICYIWCNTH